VPAPKQRPVHQQVPHVDITGNRFAELGVPEKLVQLLAAQGVTEPFPIQEATLPDSLAKVKPGRVKP
jgi:superfamily II DNA/RNA helicase